MRYCGAISLPENENKLPSHFAAVFDVAGTSGQHNCMLIILVSTDLRSVFPEEIMLTNILETLYAFGLRRPLEMNTTITQDPDLVLVSTNKTNKYFLLCRQYSC